MMNNMKKIRLKILTILLAFVFFSTALAERVCTTSTNPENNIGKCIEMFYGVSCMMPSFVSGFPDAPSCSASIRIE